jgi:hypothetical protein
MCLPCNWDLKQEIGGSQIAECQRMEDSEAGSPLLPQASFVLSVALLVVPKMHCQLLRKEPEGSRSCPTAFQHKYFIVPNCPFLSL